MNKIFLLLITSIILSGCKIDCNKYSEKTKARYMKRVEKDIVRSNAGSIENSGLPEKYRAYMDFCIRNLGKRYIDCRERFLESIKN